MQGLAENIEDALNAAIELKASSDGSEEHQPLAALSEHLEIVLPNMEIICLLHESLGGGYLPEPSVVAEWKSRFEQLSPEYDTSAHAHCRERQVTIEATFARLLAHSRQCWEE